MIGIKESSDSSKRKLIYQVPISENERLYEIIYSLEQKIG
jgi:hypothetical protein